MTSEDDPRSPRGAAASARAPRGPVRRGTVRRRLIGAALVVAAAAAAALAQDRPVAGLFPEPAKVVADYPDDAERYAALTALGDSLREKTRGGGHPGAYAKASSYHDGLNAVTAKYDTLGKDAPERVAFDERAMRLLRDAAFRDRVLARHGVAGIAAPAAPAAPPAAPVSGDVTDDMIQSAMLRAAPFGVAGLVGMAILAHLLIRNSVKFPSAQTPPVGAADGTPQIPDALRVVRLPGVEFAVEAASGVVIEKETSVETTVHTTTKQGELYTVGNTVHATPAQTQTSVTSVQRDLVWVRTAEGREESWTFVGGTFRTRRGHVLTRISRRTPDGTPEPVLAYDHATGQIETQPGAWSAQAAKGCLPWIATSALGSVAFGAAIWVLLSIGPDPVHGVIGAAAAWIEGGIAAAIVAAFIVLLTFRRVVSRRAARFESHYVPAFREFVGRSTPELTKLFA